MRPIARQSARLANHSRASSRSGTTSLLCVSNGQHIRSFNNTAPRTSDVRPPNGTPERHAWQDREHEDPRRPENGAVKSEPEQAGEAETAEAKVTSEARRPLRRGTIRQARRASEVPRPPPIPAWFLKHNVYPVRDSPLEAVGRPESNEVLRCVDASTGHTLFTLPYYEALTAPPTTVIRGKEVD
ncbi:hypothetical protein LTR53_011573, partial [Teratosphaeriaceae sp. CCFEE 6253]